MKAPIKKTCFCLRVLTAFVFFAFFHLVFFYLCSCCILQTTFRYLRKLFFSGGEAAVEYVNYKATAKVAGANIPITIFLLMVLILAEV